MSSPTTEVDGGTATSGPVATPDDRLPAFADAPVGLVLADHQGRIVAANDAWRRITGFSGVLPLDDHEAWALLHPEDRDEVRAAWAAACAGGDELEVRARMVTRDGDVRWTDTRATPVRDRSGLLLGFAGSVLDLTHVLDERGNLPGDGALAPDVADALPQGVMVYDPSGAIVAANRAAHEILGITHDDLLAQRVPWSTWDPVDADGVPLAPSELPAVRARLGEPVVVEVVGFTPPARSRVWTEVTARRVDVGDLPAGTVVASFTDISARKRTEDDLRDSEAHLRSLSESVPVGVFRCNLEGRLTYVNPRWSELTGIGGTEIFRLHAHELIHPDDREATLDAWDATLPEGRRYDGQFRILDADGAPRWVQCRLSLVRDKFGTPTGTIGSFEDVSPLVTARQQNERLAAIVESTSDLVVMFDEDSGEVLYLNGAVRELLAIPDGEDLSELTLRDLLNEESEGIYIEDVRPVLLRGETWSGELVMSSRTGEDRHVWQTVSGEFDSTGVLVRVAVMGRDVTDRRLAESELAHQATHDPLTGLPNRSLLLNHLELAIARAERDETEVGLLFLDLDRFKSVNDNRGHDVGDELLRQVSQRISGVLRPSDTVARLGGDEFVVLFDEVENPDDAVAAARRVCDAIEDDPFGIASLELVMTTSAGLAVSSPGEDPETLIRNADEAMYRAKEQGRARLEVYDEAMRLRTTNRRMLAEQLSAAILDGHIDVHYQPQVNLRTGEVVSVEALARWRHPTRGELDPEEFIQLAEDTGLIVGLGLSVLHRACADAAEWSRQLGPQAPRVAVNLSLRQLAQTNLPELLTEMVEQLGVSPSSLCLEVPESVLVGDVDTAIASLEALSEVGVSLAIDNFGKGSASLLNLQRLPVDTLKVDRSFVDGLGPDPEDSAIAAAIISLAHNLNLEVIAEGVERVEQLAELRALGCDGGQGFLFAKPMPADAVRPYFGHVCAV